MQEQGLVVVNDNFLGKFSRFLRKIFFSKKIEEVYKEDDTNVEYIKKDTQFVQAEIIAARNAFKKYIINNNKNISEDIILYVIKQIQDNREKIQKIIDINEDNITFEDIIIMLESEKTNISKFKHKNKKTGCYQVPVRSYRN